ncbi:carnitine O-acetyltransferase-like [Fopius arisanus]|uniref:Carnitine O-acetyltransferase-like n=1 Tax=Fopius arisanus TaxID=64838 RepID=A0A9R1TXB3_9HYME|nr:PREDICTED: carnitine O-acetyltransferase-like [Fopius arisanus]
MSKVLRVHLSSPMLLQNRYQSLQQINHIFNMASRKGTAQCRRFTSIQLNKQELPRQPVPELQKTAERYLRSLKPLLNDQEYLNTEKIVQDFISKCGVGPELQAKLLERYEKTDSWMNEWFLHAAYLGYRDSVLLMSSPGTVGPLQEFKSPEDVQKFAAQLIVAVATYNDLVKKGDIKQEMVGSTPLDMQPYAMILGTHRIPGLPADKQVHTDTSQHIIILKNHNIFRLQIIDDCGVPFSESKLIPAIKDIFERSCTPGVPVGILSGNQRDTWAQDFEVLRALGGNSELIKTIEEALFILCIDREIPSHKFQGKGELSVRAKQALTGFSVDTNAGNRWHDKTLQFIISPDGFFGTEYEHSPCEGGPIGVIQDFVLKYVENKKTSSQNEIAKDFPRAELLKFQVDGRIEKSIDEVTRFVEGICNKIDMECFVFDAFGTGEIKKLKMSPDSFIQTAMQVTFYKLHGKPPAHYESGGLRRFRGTRTEAIRSTSVESVEFARIMMGGTKMEKREALVKAINAHKRIAGEAVTGAGVDRHLFGLKMIAKEQNIDLPALYSDVGFTRSCHWNLTSSQVPFKSASFMCYGPVVEDGYGCCYNPRADEIFFACSSFNSCCETRTKEFADTLRQVLCDMKDISTD